MKKFLILDSHSLLHRAYHALPFLETKQGEAVNALYGFFSILIKAVNDFQPDYLAAVFDFPALTFRHQEFKEYKVKRPKTPENLVSQIKKMKQTLPLLGIPVFEKKGFEADDVIGTICNKSPEAEIVIVSGDKDLLQLVNEKVKVYLLKKGIKETVLCDSLKVQEIYQGLLPDRLNDFKGLKGDSSDNIPGVPGIGEKTAFTLIKKYNSLEKIYQALDEINGTISLKLSGFKEQAFLSRKLSLIEKNVPLSFSLAKCSWQGFDQEKSKKVFENLEFHSLVKRILPQKKTLSLFQEKS
jgi:DNA polymerase I